MAKVERKQKKGTPVEVIVFDVLQKERVIAEYYGETMQWYSTKYHKVYHPAFVNEKEPGVRYVTGIIRVLGQFDPNDGLVN